VSAVVRGTPLEVLKVLLDPDSATTILARAVTVTAAAVLVAGCACVFLGADAAG
jgi:hypothetical protein